MTTTLAVAVLIVMLFFWGLSNKTVFEKLATAAAVLSLAKDHNWPAAKLGLHQLLGR